MTYVKLFFEELLSILFDMAPWLILGFLVAGILHVFFPDGKINKLLGSSKGKSVINAALFGVPLPLCSCGVIPTGVSLYKKGASKGAAVSFLISTPQTGVDSILVTYSLLGLPFAIVRPIVAFITGIVGGFVTNSVTKNEKSDSNNLDFKNSNRSNKNWLYTIFNYAFFEFLEDIAKWLIIGLLVAALIAVFVPDDFFASYISNEFLGMLIILIASIPVYVCATSSVPIAAVLIMKGISPGAALVFLMAGPATNAATISVIGNSMGRKTLISYLATIIIGALTFGLLIDYVFPREMFLFSAIGEHAMHEHGLLPMWLKVASGIIMVLLLINVYAGKIFKKRRIENLNVMNMDNMKVIVKGMTCSHCKATVEQNIQSIDGISNAVADLSNGEVSISGEKVDLEMVKHVVNGLGYKYEGEVQN